MVGNDSATTAVGQLKAMARATGTPFPHLLNQYVCEQVLAAICSSPHRERLVLHGAWCLGAWFKEMPRATQGLDLLDIARSEATEAVLALRSATAGLTSEGVHLDWTGAHLVTRVRRPRALLRLTLTAYVGRTGQPITINVSQAKLAPLATERLLLPRVLPGRPRAYASCCIPEEMAAEKAALLVTYGPDFSRIIDYLDLLTLADRLSLDAALLLEAMRGTFLGRDAERMLGRDDGYWEAALDPRRADGVADARWARLVRLVRPVSPPGRLRDVILRVREFLFPVLHALRHPGPPLDRWTPGQGWRSTAECRPAAARQAAFAF